MGAMRPAAARLDSARADVTRLSQKGSVATATAAVSTPSIAAACVAYRRVEAGIEGGHAGVERDERAGVEGAQVEAIVVEGAGIEGADPRGVEVLVSGLGGGVRRRPAGDPSPPESEPSVEAVCARITSEICR
jgi:hypothetical protein